MDLAGWNSVASGSTGWSAARITTEAYAGVACANITWTTASGGEFYRTRTSLGSTTTYSLGMWMKISVPQQVTLRVMRDSSPFTVYASATVDVTEDRQYFSCSGSVPASMGIRVGVVVASGSTNSLLIDAVQLETGSPSWYFDGLFAEPTSAGLLGFAWTGTPHNSTSTRTASRVIWPIKNPVKHRWTIMGWFCLPFTRPTGDQGYACLEHGGHSISIMGDVGAAIRVRTIGNSGTTDHSLLADAVPGEWYFVAVTYIGTTIRGYLGDPAVTTGIALKFSVPETFLGLPSNLIAGAMPGPVNGDVMIDDLCVSRQGLTTERLDAIYESDAPVFATSSVFMFRSTAKGLVWADEEGLWMRNVEGGEVIGAYGGDTFKNWGGIDLDPSDVLIGDSDRGAYMWWDDSQGVLRIGKTGTSASYLALELVH